MGGWLWPRGLSRRLGPLLHMQPWVADVPCQPGTLCRRPHLPHSAPTTLAEQVPTPSTPTWECLLRLPCCLLWKPSLPDCRLLLWATSASCLHPSLPEPLSCTAPSRPPCTVRCRGVGLFSGCPWRPLLALPRRAGISVGCMTEQGRKGLPGPPCHRQVTALAQSRGVDAWSVRTLAAPGEVILQATSSLSPVQHRGERRQAGLALGSGWPGPQGHT